MFGVVSGGGRRWAAALVPVFATAVLGGLPARAAEGGAAVRVQVADDAERDFDVPAQPLAAALGVFGRQAGMQVTVDATMVGQARSQAVKGRFKARDALHRLLTGTGLAARYTGDRTAVLVPAPVGGGPLTLAPVTVEAAAAPSRSWQPVAGYLARQSASGTKTDAPLIETPQSISVVTADQIAATKATSVTDALNYTPGVVSQSGAFSRMADDFMIRGFNVANGNSGSLRDGMKFQSNVYDGGQEPYGLERIEVLRGASSMLYGQLGPGGVVNAISKRPTADPLHEVSVEYGRYGRKQVSTDHGGALTGDGVLSYRLTGLLREADNWVDGTNDDKRYIAPALTWRPDATTSLTLLGGYQEADTKFASPLLYGDVDGGTIPRSLFLGEPGFDRYESDVYHLGYVFEHSPTDAVTLRSAARYYHAKVSWDYMMANLAPVTNGLLYRLASKRFEESSGVTADNAVEIKVATGPVDHTVLTGVDYYHRRYDSHRYRGTGYVPLNVDDPVYRGVPTISYAVDRGSDNTSDQIGAYVQDQMRIDDRWVVVLGGRYDISDSEVRSYQTGTRSTQSERAFTGRAGVVYLFDNGVAPFVSISQSFEPVLGTDPATGRPFDPSEGLQYEAGIRYQPDGRDLLLSASVYSLTQTNVLTYDAAAQPYQQGKVESRGIELEARARFGALSVIGAYTYTDARVTESADASAIDQQVALVPFHTVSLWADRTLDDLGLTGVSVGIGARHTGETNIPGFSGNVAGYTLVDARLGLDLGALSPGLAGASLALNARNLLDKDYYTCVSEDGCRYGAPMTWTATLSYRW